MKIGFRSIHPITEFIFYGFVFFLSITATHPVTLLTAVFAAFLYDFKLRGKLACRYSVKLIIPLILLSAAINGLFNNTGDTVLFVLPWNKNFTLEAVVLGLVFALRAAAMLMWMGSFNEVLTNDKIVFLFGRISPRTALIISMALSFIPLAAAHSDEILRAERGIGSASASGSFISRMKSAVRRLSVLVTWSLERGIDKSNSMTARGYGLKGRTVYNAYRFRLKDAAVLLLCIAGFIVFFMTKNTLTAIYGTEIIIPFPSPRDIAASVYFALLSMLPFIIDFTEEKKWSIS